MSPGRRRSPALILAGISAGLLLLPSAFSHGARLTVLGLYRPLRRLAAAARDALPGPAPAGERDEIRRQNAFLRDQLESLAEENARLRDRLEQISGLRGIASPPAFRLLPADVVIPADSSVWRRTLTVAAGTRSGARPGMLAVHHRRLVGRLAECGPWESRVQLITDPGFRARAVAAPESRPPAPGSEARKVGLYQGTAAGAGVLRWLPEDSPVDPGAVVWTLEDPANGVPAGLILGRVSAVSRGRGPTLGVEVEPVLNFRGLEQVILLERAGGS